MAVKILWQPPLVPEERKKAQWENIIRFELGEGIDGLDVSLRFAEERLRWQLDTSGPQAAPPGLRGRLPRPARRRAPGRRQARRVADQGTTARPSALAAAFRRSS